MKHQPPEWITSFGYSTFTPEGHISGRGYWDGGDDQGPGEKFYKCPYGRPGERLWVRETWDGKLSDAVMGFDTTKRVPNGSGFTLKQVAYRATYEGEKAPITGRWRPSIHMPRWASRITLEITDVRVERLQEISAGDCLREGIRFPEWDPRAEPMPPSESDYYYEYRDLWERIQGPGSWEINPWVWVVSFHRVVP